MIVIIVWRLARHGLQTYLFDVIRRDKVRESAVLGVRSVAHAKSEAVARAADAIVLRFFGCPVEGVQRIASLRIRLRKVRPPFRENRTCGRVGNEEMPEMRRQSSAAAFRAGHSIQGYRLVRDRLRWEKQRQFGRWSTKRRR